jgi:hypothetical protein
LVLRGTQSLILKVTDINEKLSDKIYTALMELPAVQQTTRGLMHYAKQYTT